MNEIIDDQFNWNFPPNTFGADEGQSGTETIFSDEDNLGRESSQNSINNPIKEDEKVLVKYQFKNLNSDLFPKKNDYLKRIQSAKKFLDDIKDLTGDEIERLSEAERIIQQEKIPTLIISDFKTTGLIGEELDRNSPYYRFMKSDGISSAIGSVAGSYGLGKDALINYSLLRAITVFSKHTDKDNMDQDGVLYTGRSSLGTHYDPRENNRQTRKKGYLGKVTKDLQNWESCRGDNIKKFKIPIERSLFGTDIYIWGFHDRSQNWEINLAMGLMHAFFQAIIEDKIEFEILIEDKTYLKINKENIEKSFEYIKKEAEKINLKNELFDKFLRVSGYLKCSRGNSKYLIDRDSYIEGLGRINIKVYTNPDDSSLKNHYCIMRLPLMTIEEFKFKQMGTPYQAICKIIDEKGNIVFMNLENATHKKLSSNYVRKKGKEKQYGDLLKQVHKKVKDAIKSIDGTVSKFRSISGLEKYLSKDRKESKEKKLRDIDNNSNFEDEEIIKLTGRLVKDTIPINPEEKKKKKRSVTLTRSPLGKGKKGGSKGTHRGDNKVSKKTQGGYGAGEDLGKAEISKEGEKETIIDFENLHIVRTRKLDDNKIYKFKVTALSNAKGTLRIGYSVREDARSFVPINGAKLLNCSREDLDIDNLNFKKLELEKGENFEFEIELPSISNLAIGAY